MKLALKKPKTQTVLMSIICIVITTLSLCIYGNFIKQKYYYFQNDTFYYYSIAENLHENGIFADATADPDAPIITPQNGIVVVLWLLQLLPLSREAILVLAAWINYLLIYVSLYPLFKIADCIGLKNKYTKIALAALLLLHLTFLKTATCAINDGIFRPCCLWLIYFFFLCHKKYCSKDPVNYWKIKFIMGLMLCVVAVHFRIDAILIALSFAFAALLIREFKLSILISIFLTAMLISLSGFYVFMRSGDFLEIPGGRLDAIQSQLLGSIHGFVSILFPKAIYAKSVRVTSLHIILCLPFYASVLIALIRGFIKKNFGELSLSLVVLSVSSLIILHGAMNERYLLVILPVVYLLILIRNRLRIIGYAFIFMILFSGVRVLYKGSICIDPKVRFWTYVSDKIKLENDNTFFVSNPTRPAWFFTGVKVFTQYDYSRRVVRTYNYPFEKLLQAKHVYLAGPGYFLEEQKSKILLFSAQNFYTVNFILLTPDYHDNLEQALYKIKLAPTKHLNTN